MELQLAATSVTCALHFSSIELQSNRCACRDEGLRLQIFDIDRLAVTSTSVEYIFTGLGVVHMICTFCIIIFENMKLHVVWLAFVDNI
jgi:hypothetical protein